MPKQFLLLFFLCTTFILGGQPDAYHEQLTEWLGTQYTLNGETYPFHDTEVENFAHFGSYNSTLSIVDEDGDQDFTKVARVRVAAAQTNRWDAGWNGTNLQTLALGDKVLWVIYLRVAGDADASGKVALIAERNDNFNKEVDVTVELTNQWKRFFIPFEVGTRSHPVGGLTMGMHVGFQAQTVEIGGMAILNYGPDVPLAQLPNDLGSDEYGGFEDDAAWRAPAADRIDELRKADLTLRVLDTDGNALSATEVKVRMQRHDFDFGTAIKACRFPGGRCASTTFVDKILNLDGEGHGFSSLVFENDLKWPAWEDEWVSTNAQTIRTMQFLRDRNIDLRGHVLLWPGWQNLPDRMEDNQNNPNFLTREVDKHLTNFLETMDFDQYVKDWDVLNEINTNTDLAAALRGTDGYPTGREIYAETFARARELAPDAELYINDYIILSLKNYDGILYNQYKGFIQELVDADAPITGVGFQAHLNASPNSIYDVLDTYDDFYNSFGLDAKITEFDLPRNVPEDLAAKYLGDFLTATFSHPSMTGFMFWNFWDTDTWANPGANLYDANWNETPAHAAFTDLVFDQWWTKADLTTNDNGEISLRGFKGDYEVTFNCGDQEVTASFSHTENGSKTVDCAGLVSARQAELPVTAVTVSPNPSAGPWEVNNSLGQSLNGELFDVTGKQVWQGVLPSGQTRLSLELAAGFYSLRVTDGVRVRTLRLVRR